MLIEQDTRFEFVILANQHRGTPSVCQRIGRDEVFRLRGEIVLLATAPAKLPNLPQVRMELPIADNHLLWSLGPSINTEPALVSFQYGSVMQLLTVYQSTRLNSLCFSRTQENVAPCTKCCRSSDGDGSSSLKQKQ